MIFPATTALFAALLALLYAGLSSWVVAGRFSEKVLHGDGANQALLKRIRSHGNFAEYVPLTLILVGLLEASGSNRSFVAALLAVLLVARVLHPVGMVAPRNSPWQFVCRGGGAVATLLVMSVAALALLARAL